MSLRAGQMKWRFKFDRRTSVNDGLGNFDGPWAEQFEARARRQDLRGGESVIASRLQGVQPVVLSIYVSADSLAVTPDWRARDARTGEIFNIRAVTPAEDNRHIDLLCEKGVADG